MVYSTVCSGVTGSKCLQTLLNFSAYSCSTVAQFKCDLTISIKSIVVKHLVHVGIFVNFGQKIDFAETHHKLPKYKM